jgi:hypothetical protein
MHREKVRATCVRLCASVGVHLTSRASCICYDARCHVRSLRDFKYLGDASQDTASITFFIRWDIAREAGTIDLVYLFQAFFPFLFYSERHYLYFKAFYVAS